MIPGYSFSDHISLSSAWSGCHGSPFSHAIIRMLGLLRMGSSGFTNTVSLSSGVASSRDSPV